MKVTLSIILTLLITFFANSQTYPPLEISADIVSTSTGVTVDVPIKAGTNWQNITSLRGTITFDTNVITWNQMSFWGLSNPGGAVFTYQGNGLITFTWMSVISIGPSLSAGSTVFTLRFNAVGSGGQVSPITFSNTPQILFWNNGFGWSGNNFNVTNGSVTILGCSNPVAVWSDTTNQLNATFNDLTSAAVTSWAWDFGDGNTSNIQSPSHTYSSSGTYNVCLIVTDTCGSDTLCKNVTVTNCTVALGTDTRTECDSLIWIDGNVYYSNNNSATFNIVGGAANSCDSLVTLNLTVINNDKTITKTNTTLTSNQLTGTYQWLDCNGNQPIPGEINQSFTATSNGSYAVVISNNGCTDTSACESVFSVGIKNLELETGIYIYPNPFENQINISFNEKIISTYSLKIYNSIGKLVLSENLSNQITKIDLSDLDDGFYYVNINNFRNSRLFKVIKK